LIIALQPSTREAEAGSKVVMDVEAGSEAAMGVEVGDKAAKVVEAGSKAAIGMEVGDKAEMGVEAGSKAAIGVEVGDKAAMDGISVGSLRYSRIPVALRLSTHSLNLFILRTLLPLLLPHLPSLS
jgi:uncharacterized membrane protein (UPF0127 family)